MPSGVLRRGLSPRSGRLMTSHVRRFSIPALCVPILAGCSDDAATTAPPPPPPPEETDTADRAALIAFYNATNGRTHWREKRNWNTPESIRNWQGVETNSAGFVTDPSLRTTTFRDRSHRNWVIRRN